MTRRRRSVSPAGSVPTYSSTLVATCGGRGAGGQRWGGAETRRFHRRAALSTRLVLVGQQLDLLHQRRALQTQRYLHRVRAVPALCAPRTRQGASCVQSASKLQSQGRAVPPRRRGASTRRGLCHPRVLLLWFSSSDTGLSGSCGWGVGRGAQRADRTQSARGRGDTRRGYSAQAGHRTHLRAARVHGEPQLAHAGLHAGPERGAQACRERIFWRLSCADAHGWPHHVSVVAIP